MKKSKPKAVDASSAVRSIENASKECDLKNSAPESASSAHVEEDYLKIRSMRILDLVEYLLKESDGVGGRSTSLCVTSNIVFLKGRILENAVAVAQRLGTKKMSIRIDGDDMRISMPLDAENVAMYNGIRVNRITGRGLYPYDDNVRVRLSKSKKSVVVSIHTV